MTDQDLDKLLEDISQVNDSHRMLATSPTESTPSLFHETTYPSVSDEPVSSRLDTGLSGHQVSSTGFTAINVGRQQPCAQRINSSNTIPRTPQHVINQVPFTPRHSPESHITSRVAGRHHRPELVPSSPYHPSSDFSNELSSSPTRELSRGRQDRRAQLHYDQINSTQDLERPSAQAQSHEYPQRYEERPEFTGYATPVIRGVQTVSTRRLPDRLRSVFPFELFNVIQSRCFDSVYGSDDNFVLASPTGSGKTAVLELAICRLIMSCSNDHFKIVYQAPTKSLCAERARDWQSKFAPLGLQCAELTGDTEVGQLRSVQNASIIITTPEKWDSITRKWKDHHRLMQMVKLFLIDEVHILKDARGATLEAVVSRMKSAVSGVRFVALSATVPNSDDIAVWLGRNPRSPDLPAAREMFGEDYRPVKLKKFVYGYGGSGNDFQFDKVCDSRLPELITKHSAKKPIMIFCCTRKSAITSAKALAKWWEEKDPRERPWPAATGRLTIADKELQACIGLGVAYHHAGLEIGDRNTVEKGFLGGQINVICCTSTLAVGVNLPCHLVVIKNTMSWGNGGLQEYTDLEIMQMLGRAGRPQFDNSAIGVIMTRTEKVQHYEKMVSGQEIIESCLHLNLIEHLNAEIGLGTVRDLYTAQKWLKGTFLFVRLGKNPNHYKLSDDVVDGGIEKQVELICCEGTRELEEAGLISTGEVLECTEYGDAMARYYVKIATMRRFMELEVRAEMTTILSTLAQADEFRDVRWKGGERALYKEINSDMGVRFPIQVDLALAAHKTSLIIQAELGAVEFPSGEVYKKHKGQFQQDRSLVFQHAHRLIRCIVDCMLHRKDSIATLNALELTRSLAARVWDHSPLQMKQVESIGIVAVRKLVAAGIQSINDLQTMAPSRIELILSRNPPFGTSVLAKVKSFPRLTVSGVVEKEEVKAGQPITVKLRGDIGLLNERIPLLFNRRSIWICWIAASSDGEVLRHGRLSARTLATTQKVEFTATLPRPNQYVTLSVMCEEIAGTLRSVDIKHNVPASQFPPPLVNMLPPQLEKSHRLDSRQAQSMNISRPRNPKTGDSQDHMVGQISDGIEDFSFEDLDDNEFEIALRDSEFRHIDTISYNEDSAKSFQVLPHRKGMSTEKATARGTPYEDQSLVRLPNGKWPCNHSCKDKSSCKHMCCQNGLERPPRFSKTRPTPSRTLPVPNQKMASILKMPKLKGLPGSQPSSAQEGASRFAGGIRLATSQQDGLFANEEIEMVDLAGEEDSGNFTSLRAKGTEQRFPKSSTVHTHHSKGTEERKVSEMRPRFIKKVDNSQYNATLLTEDDRQDSCRNLPEIDSNAEGSNAKNNDTAQIWYALDDDDPFSCLGEDGFGPVPYMRDIEQGSGVHSSPHFDVPRQHHREDGCSSSPPVPGRMCSSPKLPELKKTIRKHPLEPGNMAADRGSTLFLRTSSSGLAECSDGPTRASVFEANKRKLSCAEVGQGHDFMESNQGLSKRSRLNAEGQTEEQGLETAAGVPSIEGVDPDFLSQFAGIVDFV